jgi:hypothetical protein
MVRRHAERAVARAAGLRTKVVTLGLLVAAATALASCASTLSEMPSQLGGLPAGTPDRAATPLAYPAVHDMPPARQDTVLTDEEQKQATAELTALRSRQEKQAGDAVKAPGPPQ